ncbi:MAG: transcription termination factor NusA [Dehalococcoidia bacterium]|nr:transcription termination factor NusA [Dehalococcoidia bacterium]MDW8119668.1 transcription termination factor NusA [Chloroflexota bacterium]
MKSDFLLAVTQLSAERNLPREKVIAAIEAALVAAFRKDPAVEGRNITVRLNPLTGDVKVYTQQTVVEKVTDSKKEISLLEARSRNPAAKVGDVLEIETQAVSPGRIPAQTFKQVLLQRLRDAEREQIVAQFASKVGEILPARVEREEGGNWILRVDTSVEALLPKEEQVPTERYYPGQTLQVYLLKAGGPEKGNRGYDLIVSRAHPGLLKRLFERDIPEIANGTVEIRAIAREPGSRSKVAVVARQERIDPVGTCVGLKGFRIQSIMKELQGEKVDVIQWHRDPAVFIANALSPAQVIKVLTREGTKRATVVVPDKQLSLAIGKDGQNARLAARLTGWHIEIISLTEYETQQAQAPEPALAEAPPPPPPPPPAPAPVPRPPEAVPEAPLPTPEVPLPAAAQAPQPPAPAPVPTPAHEEVAPEQPKEDIWSLARISLQPSGIRFAEDVLPKREVEREVRGKERKGKKGKRIRFTEEMDEDLEGL